MAKRIQQPIQVGLRPREEGGTEPSLFLWRERRYRVRSVEGIWKETGRWWDGEAERTVFRVLAAPEDTAAPGVYDLCHQAGGWTLLQIQD